MSQNRYPSNDPNKHPEYSYGNPPPMGAQLLSSVFGIPPAVPQDPPMRDFRNRALTAPFRLRERIRTGRPMFATGALLGETESARILAQAGYDLIFLDWEHTPMGIRELTQLIKTIQTSSEGQTAVVVRVPNFAHHHIAWVLDAGASGIIVPHCETVEQVKAIVDAARFPTHGGHRSFPPVAMTFGYNDGAPDGQLPFDVYAQAAIVVQIESDLGCKNAAELAAVPGVDALMVGSGDLRMDMGLMAGLDGTEKSYNDNLRRVISAAKANNLGAWCFTGDAQSTRKRAEQGFDMFMMGCDVWHIAIGARMLMASNVAAVREWEKEGAKVRLWDGNWGESADAEKAKVEQAGEGKGKVNGAGVGVDGQ